MNNSFLKSRTTAIAALAGGVVYGFIGAIEATQDFHGTHNTIDSTGEYLVTGGFAVALLLTAAAYREFGRRAGKPRAGLLAMVPQLLLAGASVISVIRGEDASWFNTLAPICLISWLALSVVIARGLRQTRAVPKAVAYGLPAILIATIPLAVIGGPVVTGAYWIAVGSLSLRAEPEALPATT